MAFRMAGSPLKDPPSGRGLDFGLGAEDRLIGLQYVAVVGEGSKRQSHQLRQTDHRPGQGDGQGEGQGPGPQTVMNIDPRQLALLAGAQREGVAEHPGVGQGAADQQGHHAYAEQADDDHAEGLRQMQIIVKLGQEMGQVMTGVAGIGAGRVIGAGLMAPAADHARHGLRRQADEQIGVQRAPVRVGQHGATAIRNRQGGGLRRHGGELRQIGTLPPLDLDIIDPDPTGEADQIEDAAQR